MYGVGCVPCVDVCDVLVYALWVVARLSAFFERVVWVCAYFAVASCAVPYSVVDAFAVWACFYVA